MYTLYVADDEQVIMEGIKHILDWEELGFDIIGEASNGADALNDILTLKPDLVLMDIRMPKITGLEVIKQAKSSGFDGKFIILSGYSDFDYAKTAMKLGVAYYLTKPIDEDELERTVYDITEAIQKEQQELLGKDFLLSKSRNEIINDILKGNSLEAIPSSFLTSFTGRYQAVIYTKFQRNEAELRFPFSDLFLATTSDDDFEYIQTDNLNVLLLKTDYAISRFERCLMHYTDNTPEKGSPLDCLFIAYGIVVDSIQDISQSYNQAIKLINRRFFTEKDQHILGYDSLPHIQEPKADDNAYSQTVKQQYCTLLIDYIQTYNKRMVCEVLNELCKHLSNCEISVEQAKLFLIDLFLQIKEQLTHQYTGVTLPFDSNADIIMFINTREYLYEIYDYFINHFKLIMEVTGSSSSEYILDDVLNYIDRNYNRNLKLETFAPIFGYNSSYLGKIFTKNVGESFNSYVDRVRISKAIEMLSDKRLKIYEIAKEVGYSNVDYFHKKFKKLTNISPAEYRKQKHIDD